MGLREGSLQYYTHPSLFDAADFCHVGLVGTVERVSRQPLGIERSEEPLTTVHQSIHEGLRTVRIRVHLKQLLAEAGGKS